MEFHLVIDLDVRISELVAEAEGLFDKPELQQYGVCSFTNVVFISY